MAVGGTELGTGWVTILPSAKGFQAAMDRELGGVGGKAGKNLSSDMAGAIEKDSGKSGRLGRAFGGIGVGIAAAFAGGAAITGVAHALGGFVNAAEDSQKVAKQTEAVLKSTGGAAGISADQISDLANALSAKSGVDDEVIQSGENVLATFTKVQNQAGKGNDIFNQGTSIALDMSTALGTDLQGSVIQVGKALNDPIKGISALSRVGVTFTEQQKEQIKTLVESGDTLGAQKVILGELNTEFGGMAAASATTGGKLKVVWGNIQEQIGGFLLPIFGKLGDWLSKILPKAINIGTKVFGKIIDVVKELVGYFTGGFTDQATNEGSGIFLFVNRLGMRVGEAWDVIRTVVPKIIDGIKGFVSDFVGGFKSEGTSDNFFGRIGDNVRAAWDGIRTIVPKIKDVIVSALGSVVTWIRDHWDGIKTVFAGVYDAFAGMVKFVVDHKPVLIGVLTAIGGAFVVQAALATAAAIASAAAWVAAAAVPIAIGAAVAALVAGFIYLYQKVDWFHTAVDAVWHAIVAAVKWVGDNWRGIWDGIVNVVMTAADVVATIIRGAITAWNAAWDPVKAIVLFVKNWVIDPIIAYYTFLFDVVKTAITTGIAVWNAVWDPVKAIVLFIKNWVIDPIIAYYTFLFDTAVAIIRTGVDTVKTVWNVIEDVFTFFRDRVYNPVVDFAGRLRDGVVGAIQGAVDIAKTVWSGISAIYNFFVDNVQHPIESAVGTLRDNIRDAFDAAVRMVKSVWDGLKAVVKEPINIVIGFYNRGIAGLWNFVADKVGLPTLPTVHELASGGRVPGTGNRDTVPALLTPGEFVVTKDAAKAWGPKILEQLNRGPVGTVDPGVFGYAGGGPVRSMEEVQAFAQAQAGKPYVFPLVGPSAFDCSGFVSAVLNFMAGLNPWSRRHSSGTVGGDPLLDPGIGDPRLGLSVGAKPPYTTNRQGQSVGHEAMTIGGINAEATPPVVRVGGLARGAGNSLFTQAFHVPNFGGLSEDNKGIVAAIKALLQLKIPGLGGGGLGDMLTKLFVQLPKMAFDYLVKVVPQVIKDALVEGGVAAGGSANPLGTAFGLIRNIPFLANGGRIGRDGPILAGERGPELLWGSKGQYMQDNASLRRPGGDQTVEFHYHTREPTATEISTALIMARMGR